MKDSWKRRVPDVFCPMCLDRINKIDRIEVRGGGERLRGGKR